MIKTPKAITTIHPALTVLLCPPKKERLNAQILKQELQLEFLSKITEVKLWEGISKNFM